MQDQTCPACSGAGKPCQHQQQHRNLQSQNTCQPPSLSRHPFMKHPMQLLVIDWRTQRCRTSLREMPSKHHIMLCGTTRAQRMTHSISKAQSSITWSCCISCCSQVMPPALAAKGCVVVAAVPAATASTAVTAPPVILQPQQHGDKTTMNATARGYRTGKHTTPLSAS